MRKKYNNFEYIDDDIVKIYTDNKNPFIVDKGVFDFIKSYKWRDSNKNSDYNYVITDIYYKDDKKIKTILLHRLIMGCLNEERNIHVDHISKDVRDNRLINLRIVSASQNHQNQKLRNNKRYYGGIHNKKYNKDKFYITFVINNRRYNFGPFETELDAAKQYDIEKLKILKGDVNCSLNFKREDYDYMNDTFYQ